MALASILTTILIVAAVTCDQCYPGWEFNDGSCYGLSDSQVSWAEAARVCQIYNGHLAEIDSEEENDFVKELLESKAPEKVWIGGTDIFNEGSFEWLSNGGRPLNFTDWHRGQPTDGGSHGGQDCLDLIQNNNYTWADDPCTSNYNFLCEIHALEEPFTI